MKKYLSKERIFAAFMMIFALVIIVSCRGMSFTAKYSIGPSAVPLICGILLIVFSIMVWITSGDCPPVRLEVLKTPEAKKCYLLVLLVASAIALMSFIGFWIPFILLIVLSLWLVEKHSLIKSALMGIVWSAFLYVVFVILLKMNIPLF